MPNPPLRRATRRLSSFCLALGVAWASRAPACPVQTGGPLDEGWGDAVRALQDVLAQPSGSECARIWLEPNGDRIRLTFETADGRRAQRVIVQPAELVPTIEALLVTLPAPEPATVRPLPPPSPEERALASEQDSSHEPERGTGEPNAQFAMQLGVRGGGDALFSPVAGGAASLTLNRWELGVQGAFELQYFDLRSHADSERKGSAVMVGIHVGRRERVGNVDVLANVRLAVAAPLHDRSDDGEAEARGGLYVGGVFPRDSGVRFRVDLGVDRAATRGQDVSITPDWALQGLLGVELGGT